MSDQDRNLVDTLVEDLEVVAGTVKVAGIDWHRTFRSASKEARGKKVPADDKPILCFCVLGSFSGFM